MRNLIMLLALFLVVFSSCKKDETTKDLTTNIVGVYDGQIESSFDFYDNQKVSVVKVSDTEVRIEPFLNSHASSFYATLKEGKDGSILLTIDEAAGKFSDGSTFTIRGKVNMVKEDPSVSGYYLNTNKTFGYFILISYDGSEYEEMFLGNK